MPTCRNCQNQWSWKQTCRKSMTLDTGMICPYCGIKQYASSRTNKLTTLITIITIAFVMLMNLIFGPSIVFIFVMLAVAPFILGLYPFWLELSNKEQEQPPLIDETAKKE